MKSVHIGSIIRQVKDDRRITDEELAERVSLTRQAVQGSYAQSDMSTAKLRKFKEALNYDFFKHLVESGSEEQKYPNEKFDIKQFQEAAEKYNVKNESHVSVTFQVPADKTEQLMKLLFS